MLRDLVALRGIARSCLLLAMLGPSSAFAWTDAHVESVDAALTVDDAAVAQVALNLDVRVRAGWLEGLEIAGLDADLDIDASNIQFVSENGERFVPSVRVRERRVSLRFPRHSAPRRGHYRVSLRYDTDLSDRSTLTEDEQRVRVQWSMPGWQTGMDGVVVEITAPEDASFPDDDDALATIDRSVSTLGDRSVLKWRRAHLPRTLPWTVAFEVPVEAMRTWFEARESVVQPEVVADLPQRENVRALPAPHAGPLGAVLLTILALFTFVFFERNAKAHRARPRPWIRLGAPGRGAVMVLFGGLATVGAWSREPWWAGAGIVGLLLLTGQRAARRRAPGLGRWRQVTRDDLDRAPPSPPAASWFDATTARGTFVWACSAVLVASVHVLDIRDGRADPSAGWIWACLVVPLLLATARRIPPSPMQRLTRACEIARQIRVRLPGPAIALALHESAHGEWQDARIRLLTDVRPSGLLRLDIALDDRGVPYGVFLTRQESEAESQARALPELESIEALRGPGGRIVRVLPVDAAIRLTRRFEEVAKPAVVRRRTSRPGRARSRPSASLH